MMRMAPVTSVPSVIRGVIFDMDGVLLLGANRFHRDAWGTAFDELGLRLTMPTAAEYAQWEGRKGAEVLDLLLARNHLGLDQQTKAHVYARKRAIFAQIDRSSTPAATQALVVRFHRRGLRLAVASGNSRDVVDRFLEARGWSAVFDATVTGDDVQKGKPDPAIFRRARQQLGLPRSAVVVVENTPLGIAAAKRAGLYTVALTSTLPAADLGRADVIIDDLRALTAVIAARTRPANQVP
jgi:beta-phosphoglucomutase